MPPRNPASLFETTLHPAQLDPAFVHIRDGDLWREDRRYLEELWSRYRGLADPHFHDQIQRRGQFNSRVWEMQLACLLMDRGLSVTCPDQGPDIRIAGDGLVVHLEAVAPATTDALDANHARAKRSAAPVPEEEVILRYTSSIKEKWEKLLHYRETGLVNSADCFVIAISAGNLSWASDEDGPWILKPLFGLGDFYVEIELETGRELGAGFSHAPTRYKLTKSGRSPIETDLFLSDKRSQVSAVLFSPHHVGNRPEIRGRPPGSDLVLCHNPFADVRVPEAFLGMGQEWAVRDGYLEMIGDYRAIPHGANM